MITKVVSDILLGLNTDIRHQSSNVEVLDNFQDDRGYHSDVNS